MRTRVPTNLGQSVNPGCHYTDEQRAFLRAIDALKRRRPLPTWAEVLAAAVAAGWRRVAPAGPLPVYRGGRP